MSTAGPVEPAAPQRSSMLVNLDVMKRSIWPMDQRMATTMFVG
jgi:hypothetical protein